MKEIKRNLREYNGNGFRLGRPQCRAMSKINPEMEEEPGTGSLQDQKEAICRSKGTS